VGIMKKVATSETRIDFVQLGDFGLWLEGGRHVLYWQFGQIEARKAGNVLIWRVGDRTFRLEGALDKGQMLALAGEITR
jgi:hypothetical protein